MIFDSKVSLFISFKEMPPIVTWALCKSLVFVIERGKFVKVSTRLFCSNALNSHHFFSLGIFNFFNT